MKGKLLLSHDNPIITISTTVRAHYDFFKALLYFKICTGIIEENENAPILYLKPFWILRNVPFVTMHIIKLV